MKKTKIDISKVKIDISKMNEYLENVKKLKGTKVKIEAPLQRAIYEDRSVIAGRWLTLEEFEESLSSKYICKRK